MRRQKSLRRGRKRKKNMWRTTKKTGKVEELKKTSIKNAQSAKEKARKLEVYRKRRKELYGRLMRRRESLRKGRNGKKIYGSKKKMAGKCEKMRKGERKLWRTK